MNVKVIDSKNLPIIEYRHIHDATIKLKSFRENYNFGLIVNQYYFNEKARDKKTNYNTQYTLTDTYQLSTIAELNLPFTTAAVSAFTTTIKSGDKFLKTDFSDLNSITSSFVAASEFSNLSSQFFFTFHVSSLSAKAVDDPVNKTVNKIDTVFISQEFNSVTYYLSAPATDQNITAKWSTIPYYFYYSIDNNYPVSGFNSKLTLHTVSGSNGKNVLMNNSDVLYLSAPGSWQNTVSDLSATFFDINRYQLTKDFKTLPSRYHKYKSGVNTDNVATTNVTPVSNNYFVFNNNYNFFQNNKQNKFISHIDLFPLKNQATLHEYYSENNHYNYEPDTYNRVYEKIHAGTHQQHGYDKINVSYNIGTYDMNFKPNKMTFFTTPNSISPYTRLNINDSKIENLGSIPGTNPLMSDKVFKRREVIKNNNMSDNVNPMYLCSWLSGNSDGDTKWVDRYYNPLASNFSKAMSGTSHYKVITAAGAETTETFDVSSSLTFEPNNDYAYYHVGDQDYEKLFEAFDEQYNTTTKTEYLNFKGVPIPEIFVKKDRELILDGNSFARNNTDIQGDLSINFWLHTNNTNKPLCYKLLGNYFEDGLGVFNTDLVTPNIILPVVNDDNKRVEETRYLSKLLFLNNDFEIYDYLIVKEGLQEVNIVGLARKDNFSEYYVLGYTLDKNKNQKYRIYIYNNNNHLIGKIENLHSDGESVVIDDFEVGEDKLYVLFKTKARSKYFVYNIKTNKTSPVRRYPVGSDRGKQEKLINKNDKLYYFTVDRSLSANSVTLDSKNNPFVIKQDDITDQSNPRNHIQKLKKIPESTPIVDYRNKGTEKINRILTGLDTRQKILSVLTDDEDKIIVLHSGKGESNDAPIAHAISILNNDRKLLRTRQFCQYPLMTLGQPGYIDLIFDFEGSEYKKYILLIQQFSSGMRMTKIDFETLRVVYSKKFNKTRFVSTDFQINVFNLIKTVTTYSYLQKTGANKKRMKVILKKRPKFSTTGKLPIKKSIIDFDFTKLSPGYNHFFINISLSNGYMELFVNGKLVEKVNFTPSKYALANILETGLYVGACSTPFYLTLANKLLQPNKYFVHNAKIKGFKIYNKTMNYFDMLAHYNYHLVDKDVIWSYPLGQRTYVDTIDKLFKFNYPEKLSNKYKVNILHTEISDPLLLDKIKDRVKLEMKKITPYYDELKNISIT